jgi:hypothetical protein
MGSDLTGLKWIVSKIVFLKNSKVLKLCVQNQAKTDRILGKITETPTKNPCELLTPYCLFTRLLVYLCRYPEVDIQVKQFIMPDILYQKYLKY